MLLIAVRNVAEAQKMSKVAQEANVSRESLYKTLSGEGNPLMGNLRNIVNALGLKIIVVRKESVPAEHYDPEGSEPPSRASVSK